MRKREKEGRRQREERKKREGSERRLGRRERSRKRERGGRKQGMRRKRGWREGYRDWGGGKWVERGIGDVGWEEEEEGKRRNRGAGFEASSVVSALSSLNPSLSRVQGASVPGSAQASVPPARPPIPMLFSPLPSCQLS